ncbi:MAG: hypothetical protein NTX59_06745 [Elusimicrobia bacterium]|nr:hypothetical protein [Elusimicrobiota bacterium]
MLLFFAGPILLLIGLLIIAAAHCLTALLLYAYLVCKNPGAAANLRRDQMGAGFLAASYFVLSGSGFLALWFHKWLLAGVMGAATGVLLFKAGVRRPPRSRLKASLSPDKDDNPSDDKSKPQTLDSLFHKPR